MKEKDKRLYTEVGKTFEFNGKTYRVVPYIPCDECAFQHLDLEDYCMEVQCINQERQDNTSVGFIEVKD